MVTITFSFQATTVAYVLVFLMGVYYTLLALTPRLKRWREVFTFGLMGVAALSFAILAPGLYAGPLIAFQVFSGILWIILVIMLLWHATRFFKHNGSW